MSPEERASEFVTVDSLDDATAATYAGDEGRGLCVVHLRAPGLPPMWLCYHAPRELGDAFAADLRAALAAILAGETERHAKVAESFGTTPSDDAPATVRAIAAAIRGGGERVS